MKRKQLVTVSFLSMFTGLFLASCSTTGTPETGTRKEYQYVPPVYSMTPASQTDKPGLPEKKAEDDREKNPSFFGKLFGGESSGDEGKPTVARVGDEPETEVNEDGETVVKASEIDNVYRLKKGDALFISLSGSGGLDEEIQTIIDEDGAIKLRFIGSVKALGLSSTELENEIEAEYTERQKIFKDLTVRVVVPNTFYSIGGEVRQPGRFPLIGRVTLSQAVVAAGNFTEWADERDIVLVRNKERIIINFRKIRENPKLDVELLAGDWIWVDRTIL